ncbi:SA1002 family membrane protein [Enterococcus faecalis]|uniref:SA1002 family membrane protein n=1 Tax=Enterococcus faecalis TaxID=1351 RepID=UPI000352733C|nr:hypothetical protein [Enterococcus faecalis]EGO6635375.1 hypothetical protein [Enterococcus faecalis]EGO9141512.1 hypothetical protein [Enterococcus faecalis]EPH69379.1 hypothetical protein D928_02580 [Enterococcus faecalis 20-SD-BW-06]EPI00717.1 hypothetical protein D919_01852 [Enterococcus faecalis 20-SD-BW-08]RBS03105.1 hypothetical protein EA81_00321 [Enterococcus faecalis]
MIELILLLSVILLGLLIGNKRVDKWLFLKALLLFSVMLSVSILISVAMYLLLTIGVANVIGEQLELGIVVIISTSLLLYFLLNLTTKKIVLPIALMKIIEYYIQWVLIYVTIYQVIFDQFIVSSEVKNTLQGTIDEPVAIIIVILPSFISIWIAVVLFRIRMEEL